MFLFCTDLYQSFDNSHGMLFLIFMTKENLSNFRNNNLIWTHLEGVFLKMVLEDTVNEKQMRFK